MPKHSMLSKKMSDFFDFAAINPIQGPLMTQQMMMPMVLLRMLEQQEREMQLISQAFAEEADKSIRAQHEQKTLSSSEEATKGESTSSTSFSLVYYNPETNEMQVVEEEFTIKLSDYEKKEKGVAAIPFAPQTAMAVDQSLGEKSTYPLYMNVATPLAREVIDPVKLEIALSKIEIESPKPFGGGAAVFVAPQVFDKVEHALQKEGIHEEIVAVEMLKEVESMRKETVHQLDEQIKSFEHVIEEIEVTDVPVEELVEELPPLSRERYSMLLKKQKMIAETVVVDMLIADLEFLIVVKKKLKTMGLRELVETLKKLGKFPSLGATQRTAPPGRKKPKDGHGKKVAHKHVKKQKAKHKDKKD